jgi:hypothetical protein
LKTALETFRDWRAAIGRVAQGLQHAVPWDIETPGLDPTERTLCLSWYSRDGELCSHWGNLLEAVPFLDELEDGTVLVAHNAKFEAQALIARGIDARRFVWWDTMLGEWVLLANNPRGLGVNLDDSAQRYGCDPKDPEVQAMLEAGKAAEVEPDKLLARNVKDVSDTNTIFREQLARMSEAQVRLTIVRSMRTIELAYMRREGMALDPVRVNQEFERNAAEIREHELALRDITRGANPKSVNEMAPVLFGIWPEDVKPEDRTGVESLGFPIPAPFDKDKAKKGKCQRTKPTKNWPDGKPSIAKEVMAALAAKAKTPRQQTWAKHYMALTEAIAERDKNLIFYKAVCDQAGGIVYADLIDGRAATHRLTCQSAMRLPVTDAEGKVKLYGCQLQNTPRHLKGCFVARHPDYLACSVDQSQAEYRGAIFLADDHQGREDIKNPNFDAHVQSGQVIQDGVRDAVRYALLFAQYKAGDKDAKYIRDNAKPHTFKPLFGGSSGTDAERAYYKWFGRHYAGVTQTQNEWDQEVQQTGRYVAPTGMVFHWDRKWVVNDWGRDNMVNQWNDRSLYSIVRNLPIQYFATGELAMVSSLCLAYEARLQGIRYRPVMLIHDDTSGEVHKDDVARWHRACGDAYGPQTWAFLLEVYDINYDVELASESKAGVRFGEGSAQVHSYTSPLTEDIENMKLTSQTRGPRKPRVEAKTHLAIINAVVDLGVQKGSAKFPKPKRKVYVGFEFPKVKITYPAKDGKPEETVPAREGRFMALSMNELATFRKFVEGLEGKKFASDKEACEYEPKRLLARACMLPVTHKVVGDDIYTELGNPLPLMDGMEVSDKLAKDPLYYDTDAPDPLAFKALPEWMQEVINARVMPSDGAADSPAPISGGLKDLGQE